MPAKRRKKAASSRKKTTRRKTATKTTKRKAAKRTTRRKTDAISNGSVDEVAIFQETEVEELFSKEKALIEKSSNVPSHVAELRNFLLSGGSKDSFRTLLTTFYGEKLITRVFPESWGSELSKDHCIEILDRIGHAVTVDDLEEFYAELKSGAIKSKILNHSNVPYLRMWWSPSVRDLPPFWIGHFLSLFRDPLNAMNLEVSFENRSYVDHKATQYTIYTHHLKRLQEKGDRTCPEFTYASRELLAKSIAYSRPESVFDGAVVGIYNHSLDREVYYTLQGQIHDSGLDAYLFVPLEKGKEFPAQLIFRGTNDGAGVGRNLDAQGVGKRVFAANLDKIEALIKASNARKIEVIGHSLGGADAQRAVALLVDPLRNFELDEISLFAFCAPRLEIERVDQWKADLQTLSEQNKHPVIRLNFAYHESDAITWAGDAYLMGAELDFIYTNYLIVKSDSGAFQTPMHHRTSFFLDGNFNRNVDGRTFVLWKSFPNYELQRLEKPDYAFWQWWKSLKGCFVKVETLQERERRIEEIKKHQFEISMMEKGGTQHSWAVYSTWNAIRYTLQPMAYYIFEGLRSINK